MKLRKFQPKVWFVILVLILISACGSGTQEPTQEAVQSEQLEPQETEDVEASSNEVPTEEGEVGAISSLDEAKNAVIQIEADGTFVNPDFSVSYNDAGFGSGFIIDPSGLAVTNNHVVTGAALLKVWIGGETGKTYNAKVVGVSE
jgi:serine protease Do